MTAPDELVDGRAATLNVARRILFSLCLCERSLGLPCDSHALVPIRERCERILRAAQCGGLEAGLYSLAWNLFRFLGPANGVRSEAHGRS
jgi:hypothetical protein